MKNITLIILLLCTGNALAAIDILLQGGLHFGGDELVEADFTNGDDEKIKAGQLLSLSVGIGSAINESVEARLMVGVKFDSIDASNADIEFYRYPVSALFLYSASEKINIGGGLTYHLNPSLSGDGVASDIDADFDDALGFVLTAEYALSNRSYAAVQYTKIDYDIFDESVSGNSIGGIFGVRF